MLETTKNGIGYKYEIVSSEGAAFILFTNDKHSQKEIKKAKNEIEKNRDVVSLRIASEFDWDDLYVEEVFTHPETKSLKWYEIEQDESLIRRERKRGTSVDDFVKFYVLPNIEKCKAKMLKKYGGNLK